MWQDGANLYVDWLGDENSIPYYFCKDEVCDTKIQIALKAAPLHFDFYPGKDNYVLVTMSDGIYAYEIDERWSAQNFSLLISDKKIDFRIGPAGTLYIKKLDDIYIADL